MAIRGILKTFLPSGWLYGEVEDLKSQNLTLFRMIKGLFAKPIPERQETFEEAMARLNLTEADVKATAKKYLFYSIVFFTVAVIIFVYAFYLLFEYISISGWLLGMAATSLCLAQAFRFNFWSYQMRERRLGITLREWMRSILGTKGTSA